jgi:glycogen debranching enzyme
MRLLMKKFEIFSLLLLFLSGLIYPQTQLKVGFLADKEYSNLSPEEKCAFDWLKRSFPKSELITFEKIAQGSKIDKYDLIWWHYDNSIELPAISKKENVKAALKDFARKGKGILLTLLAAQYTTHLGIETVPPNKIFKEKWVVKDTYKEIKGFHSFAGHPVFNGLLDGAYSWNTKQNYDFAAAYYDGLLPANGKVIAIGWDYITFKKNERHIIEYNLNEGKCISIGSYIYFADEKNVYKKHLEKLMTNSFSYLVNKKNKEKVSYWAFDKLDFEIKDEKPSGKMNAGKSIIDLSKNSGIEIKRDTSGNNYCESSGLRTTMMGKERGGLDEVWVHPLRAFMNYSVSVILKGSEIKLNDLNPKITVRPEATIRNYNVDGLKAAETLCASRNLPSGIVNYKIISDKPSKIKIKFEVDNRVMWPYDEDFPGKYYVLKNEMNNSVEIKSGDNSIGSIFGLDMKCTSDIKVLDTKANTKYVQIEFTADIPEGVNNFNFVFASSNESAAATEKYYRKTIAGIPAVYKENVDYYKELFSRKTVIETPDKEFNDAYKWALAGVDKFFIYTYPLGSSLMAGLGTTERGWDGGQKINGRPGYAWYFGRDSEWTSLALLDYGDFEKVKSVLEFLGKYQDLTGKIFHELTSSNAVHYDAADATPLYVILMGKYLDATGDIAFVKQEWNKIKKAIDFCYSTDTDKDGLIENTNVGHGWVEGGKIYGAHVTFYLVGLWASTLEYGSKIAAAISKSDLAVSYKNDCEKVKNIIERDFWNNESKFYNDGKNIDGSFSPTKTIQVTVPFYFDSTNPSKSAECVKELFGNDYTTNWGARIIGETNPLFNPRAYHYGSVWPLFTGWAALAEYKYGYSLQGFQHVMNNLLIYKNWGLGYVEEVLNGIEYKPAGVCSHQAWSESMSLQPLLEGMIGVKPDKLSNILNISPQMPAGYSWVNVNNIPFGNKKISMNYKVQNGTAEYILTSQSGAAINVTMSPKLVLGSQIKRVLVNGKEKEYQIKNGKIEFKFIHNGNSEIKIETAGGIALQPIISHPNENEKPYGTRILDENLSENQYTIDLEGIPEMTQKLTLLTDRIIKRISGGVIAGQNGATKIIEVKFPKTDKNYAPLRVKLEF